MIAVRSEVGKQLEGLRSERAIGSPLDAEVDLYCTDELFEVLSRLEEDLRFLLITSYARVHPVTERPADVVTTDIDGLWIKVEASRHPKCSRCWHHREDVGIEPQHPQLCGRCVENVVGAGESRRFA